MIAFPYREYTKKGHRFTATPCLNRCLTVCTHKDLSAAGILSYIRDDKILLTIKSELFFVAMGFILIAFMPVFCFLVTVHCSSSCVHKFFLILSIITMDANISEGACFVKRERVTETLF